MTSAITTYFVRSSVLGGQVVTELNTSGINSGTHKTHVYLNGTEIALYDSWLNVVIGKLSNPVTGSGWQELDPLGGYVGFADPFAQNPNTTYDSLRVKFGSGARHARLPIATLKTDESMRSHCFGHSG